MDELFTPSSTTQPVWRAHISKLRSAGRVGTNTLLALAVRNWQHFKMLRGIIYSEELYISCILHHGKNFLFDGKQVRINGTQIINFCRIEIP